MPTSSFSGMNAASLPDVLDDKRDIHLLCLIASGLIEWREQALREKKWKIPPPPALQRGWNLLAFRCLQHRQPLPVGIPDLLRWCERSLDQWPINPEEDWKTNWTPDELQPFLENGIPTQNCEFWSWRTGDIESEITQSWTMKELFDLVGEAGPHKQELYAYFRRTLIVNPVVLEWELLELQDKWERILGKLIAGKKEPRLESLLKKCYERVAIDMALEGQLKACPVCGHLLHPTKERTWMCEDQNCYPKWEGSLPLNRSWKTREPLYQLSRPYRRYLSRPGRCEVSLEREITSLGAKVQLWPRLDACDLDVIFPSGEVWCVDVKDWENPRQLGRHIRQKRQKILEQPGARHFFVVPQRRLAQNPDYLAALCAVYNYRTPEVLGEREFLKLVTNRLGEERECRR